MLRFATTRPYFVRHHSQLNFAHLFYVQLSALPVMQKVFTAALPDTPFVFGFAVHWIPNSIRGYPVPKYDTGGFRRDWNLKGTKNSCILFKKIFTATTICSNRNYLDYSRISG